MIPLLATRAVYDRGDGAAAFDDNDVLAGQPTLFWNGALRFVVGAGAQAYGYDRNGNRSYALSASQTDVYTYTVTNQLYAILRNGAKLERYRYDETGQRYLRQTPSAITTYVNPDYEVTNGVATTYYSFNGQRVALRRNGVLTYLHADHLGSTLLATDASGTVVGNNQPRYFAYGRERTASLAALPTDYTFTGQKQDGSGLVYMNARYYDPQTGQFISPDSLVPDATNVFDYNRYLYGLGNPVKFSDLSGHFSEDQLVGWYGKNWRDRFTSDWAKLLLDNPNSQIMGAQLGDLVVVGQGHQQQQMVFVLNQAGSLALWNVNTKTAQDVTGVGSQATPSLGLYRIAGGETGSVGTRYGYLTGETQYLTGVNGNGTGPYTMKALAEYSTNLTSSETQLGADWFMGKGGQGYYVYNSMTFQGFNFGSTVSTLGSGGTMIGAVDLVQTLWKGQKPTGLGVVGTAISVATMIYGSMMYRPTYTLSPCSSFGVNYCGGSR